jgi:hypothetical protein
MRFIILFFVVALAAGCGGSASVQQDWDPDYDFTDLGSYGWLPLRATPNIGEMRLKRLVAAIDAEMASKGMKLTADGPDVLLVLHVISEKSLKLDEYGYKVNWDKNTSSSSDLDKGSIMIDVLDFESREMVFRAVADGKVDPSSTPEEQNKKFAKLAKKLFEKFPPPPGQ